jgi:hypothetical protein
MNDQSPTPAIPQPSTNRPLTAQSPPDHPEIASFRPALDLLNTVDFHSPSKPPNVLSVLRLYCIHGLSAAPNIPIAAAPNSGFELLTLGRFGSFS